MKNRLILGAILASVALSSKAEIPAPEKLLPQDTLVLVTAPDAAKLRENIATSAASQLWSDPAMKAFKDKFVSKFKTEIVEPLEKDLKIKFSDYENLAQGQVTFAVTQNGWQGKTNQLPGWILLLDTKEKSGVLKTNLADVKKKWVDSGKQIKTEKIRDIEFTTLITSSDEISSVFEKVFPRKKSDDDDEKPAGKKIEILVGQSDSLLVVGSETAVIEKVLAHLSGGSAPALTEEAAYQSHYNSMFRDAPLYAWLNVKPFVEIFTREAGNTPSDNPLAPKPEKIVASSGIGGLKTVALSFRTTAEGTTTEFSLGIPEAARQGIFKILTAETKDSTPPSFIPADVTKFMRWRIDLPKAWTGLETMLSDISPAIGGAFKLIFESAGKDKDPNYDLKKELFTNIGDDFINYQRVGKGTLANLNSPPSIYLLGSPNAEKLASAIKVGMGIMTPDPIKERDFLGRKIYTVPPSPMMANDPKTPQRNVSFTAGGSYVALSTDVPMLEEYLRSSETKPKPLSETAGLKDAAEKVGGMGTGLFGFTNQRDEMRATFAALKDNSATLSDLVKNPAAKPRTSDEEKKLNDWADFTLLPSFDAVSKYFHYSVYAGAFNANGFTLKFFAPTPPELKK